MKYTPGPWIADLGGSYADCSIVARTLVHHNPIYIGRVYGEGGATRFENCPEKVANARLIAAAPEMLGALIECEVLLGAYPVIKRQVKAAIAKALGE